MEAERANRAAVETKWRRAELVARWLPDTSRSLYATAGGEGDLQRNVPYVAG